MLEDKSQEWNMNMGWLEYINRLIISYGMARMSDDYDGMYKSLVLLEHTISPKVDKDAAEFNINKIKVNIRRMIKKDESGAVMCYFPSLIDETLDLADITYSLILQKLDKEGILTKKRDDPRHAMGRFGGS